MNEEVSKEDQDWFAALSGKAPEGIDPLISAQAIAVRNALASRREAIEADAMKAGGNRLNEIRALLQRDGLMASTEISQTKKTWWSRVLDIFGFGAIDSGTKTSPLWGVATMLTIAVLVVFQMGELPTDESMVYRGDPNATTLIVENPELRANEIVAGVNSLIADGVGMTKFKDGKIRLYIKDSENVRDYLSTQRIEAMAVNGVIKIDVVPVKK